MSKPVILTVDDDSMVSAAIARDLRSRYGADYRIMRAASGPEALTVLSRLALRDQPVALIVADQRMPQMTGIEMLKQARNCTPGAKYLLLTAYADTDVAIKEINEIGLDYYLPRHDHHRLPPRRTVLRVRLPTRPPAAQGRPGR